MPALPADAAAATSAGTEAALAYAIEAARFAKQHGREAPTALQPLFTRALADLIRGALAPLGGDPAFQALVLRARDADVEEHVRLAAQAASDRRSVRAAVDAVAHPGKLRGGMAEPLRAGLAALHRRAAGGEWIALRAAAQDLLAHAGNAGPDLQEALRALLSGASLQRLERGAALLQREGVQQYLALCEQRGPLAGSDAAAAQGRASARAGARAEHATFQAFGQLAALLDRVVPAAPPHRAVRSLHTPRGFPGEACKAKDEWDVAIVRRLDVGDATEFAEVVLLAEVKASPSAATTDFPRLLRGLQRLAHASAEAAYAFPSADGEVLLPGASLRRLQPHGQALPPQVIYCCSGAGETQPQVLGAATRAVLLAEPPSLAFAHHLLRGEVPDARELAGVWDALATAPHLRSALHQYDTARAAREAMLHPDDLLATLTQMLAAPEG